MNKQSSFVIHFLSIKINRVKCSIKFMNTIKENNSSVKYLWYKCIRFMATGNK